MKLFTQKYFFIRSHGIHRIQFWFQPNLNGINHKSTLTGIPLLETAFSSNLTDKIAFTDRHGQNFKFSEFCSKSLRLSDEIKQLVGQGEETRIAFLCPRDPSFPTTLWAIWISGNVAVPLIEKYPENMLEYVVRQSDSTVVVTTSVYADKMKRITDAVGTKLHVVDFDKLSKETSEVEARDVKVDNALILFTSGTTGQPKGVLLSHKNVEAQVENICVGFDITKSDTMLHVLPLHHTHGLIHALISPFSVGARCHMIDFDGPKVWDELLSGNTLRPNLLMGVPTVYSKLVKEYDKSYMHTLAKVELVKEICQSKMRIMLSGSASLPVPVLERWEQITGHRILERYGMTEIGVALSNPLHGLRKPGFVGLPFQSVQLRIVDLTSRDKYTVLAKSNNKGTEIFGDKKENPIGDLLVKGPSVFKEYWKNPEATKKEFTHDGWFITGDIVKFAEGSYKILGRKSVDIIKSGGYKLSALEIETQLLAFDEIQDVSVYGLNDPEWGQKVAAMIVWKDGKELSLEQFRELAKKRLPAYACPSVIKSIKELPKNQLGKVNKKELVKLF